jgi:nicotinamidase-related amidase
MIPFPQNAALILIDIQKGFEDPMWGRRNNPDSETNVASLLHVWRQTGRPIFHVQHLSQDTQSPLRAGSPGSEIKDIGSSSKEVSLLAWTSM